MQLALDEVRRLTGANLLWDKPGAILDVLISGIDSQTVVDCWQRWMDKILCQFDWQEAHTFRLYDGGASMALSAPMDALYTACDLAELAWDACVAELQRQPDIDWQGRLSTLKEALLEEQNPKLLSLLSESAKQGVTAISDDDEFSLGMGPSVQVWPITALPDIGTINWSMYQDIPRAFITGTNGKSTSVRLASEIAKAAGYCAGVTSTDFIKVGEDIIDTGDYSGPGGARMLLRDKRTEIAFLEVARGGILRRGLPIPRVNAALVTNVASDHLGQYGINTVPELAQTKFVVSKGLDAQGTLVTNADNSFTVAQASNLPCKVCWFSENKDNPLIKANLANHLPVVFCENGMLTYVDETGSYIEVAHVHDVPMTLAGAAKHNVQNALGVIGLSMALQIPLPAIRNGLKDFASNAQDNPGRGNLYQYQGATVIMDFAHNAHSVEAMIDTAKRMNAKRYIVMFSNAGDRSNEDIRQLSQAVARLKPDLCIIAEIEKYLRGRSADELIQLAKSALLEQAVDESQITVAATPVAGAKIAMHYAQKDDVILLFTLDQREQVHQLLA